MDEAALVSDLVAALRAESALAARAAGHPAVAPPVLATFHVGITRVEGDGLRGSAVTWSLGLLRDLVPVAEPPATLVVGMSASLFGDIGSGGDLCGEWLPLPGAGAVFRAW